MFVERPSKKDYPDYYSIITQPMDMKTIDEKIKRDAYSTSEEALADFKLMFQNCRKYVVIHCCCTASFTVQKTY